MIAPNHDWRLDLAFLYQVIHGQSELCALAISQPADARRQTLELNAFARQVDPAIEDAVLREQLRTRSSVTAMSAGSPESATHRNGPRPSQNNGRIYAGTKPGKS